MATIKEITVIYQKRIDFLDLELIIAHILKKSREFVLTHPDFAIAKKQEAMIKQFIRRRIKHEPLAYIVGHKEFFGLNFKVNRHTLIPRPETELLVELAIQETRNLPTGQAGKKQETHIIDIGTGSGNIIISLAHNMQHEARNKTNLFATDISPEALKVAKYNAKKHKQTKIKFLHGSLLGPIINNTKHIIPDTKYIILANLPYLSKEIYNATTPTVKKFEPRSALYSAQGGLAHYEKLLKQIKKLATNHQLQTTSFFEISPEQKPKLHKFIKSYFPEAKIKFHKDLAGKWRVCKVSL